MRLGVLFSGGKDSTLPFTMRQRKKKSLASSHSFQKTKKATCFILQTLTLPALQAEALGLPQITKTTEGEKEKELLDLEDAIAQAAKEYQIEGVVTGAIESVYQAERVQRICYQAWALVF